MNSSNATKRVKIRPFFLPAAAVFACLAVTAVWGQPKPLPMEQKKPSMQQMQPQQQLTLPGQCATPDKVAATGLSLNPPQPKQGQAVVVTLTIKNLCNVPLSNIAWQIASTPDNTILGSGTWAGSVGAGQSFNVTAPWTAVAGQRGFDGRGDPANALRESANEQRNNIQTASVNVPQVSAVTQGAGTTPPRMVTETLNYGKAKIAGANFSHNLAPGTIGCNQIGQFEPGRNDDTSIRFIAFCRGFGKATPAAYENFQLKNGWKIKRVEDPVLASAVIAGMNIPFMRGTDWQWVGQPPQEGSDNPKIQMLLEPRFDPILGSNFVMTVKVLIEGPEGTCPYKVTTGPC